MSLFVFFRGTKQGYTIKLKLVKEMPIIVLIFGDKYYKKKMPFLRMVVDLLIFDSLKGITYRYLVENEQ